MDYSETETPKLTLMKTDRIRALFQTKISFEKALSELLIHGYSRAEIVVKIQEEVAERRYFVAGPADDSDEITFQKAIRGIKLGVVAGSLLTGLIISFFIQFNDHMLQAGPLASILFGLVVGAVWGGTLGFIIGPHLPFNRLKNYELTLSKGQILLSFQPRSPKDEHFFKSLNWPMYTLAR